MQQSHAVGMYQVNAPQPTIQGHAQDHDQILIVAEQLNMFPAKGGISTHYCPYMILKGKALDFNKQFLVLSGAYGQANNQPHMQQIPMHHA